MAAEASKHRDTERHHQRQRRRPHHIEVVEEEGMECGRGARCVCPPGRDSYLHHTEQRRQLILVAVPRVDRLAGDGKDEHVLLFTTPMRARRIH